METVFFFIYNSSNLCVADRLRLDVTKKQKVDVPVFEKIEENVS